MIVVVDQHYKYLLANAAFLKYRGLDREQVVGRSAPEVPGKDVFENVVKKNLDTCFQGEVVQYEMKYIYPELGERDLLVSYFPIENPDGINRVVSVIRDITDRKRAEESVKRLAQENTIMAEIGQIISSTLNINEVYECFAEEARKLIPFDRIMINLIGLKNNTSTTAYIAGIDVPGRRAGDITSMAGTVTGEVIRTRSSLLIQVDNDNIDEVVRRFPPLLPTFQAGLRSLIFVPLISKDQVIGVLSLRATKPNAYTETDLRLTEKVGNQIAGAIANTQLFIEHQRTEEALRVSKDRYRDLVEHSQDMICIHDLEGWIISINQAATKLLGYEQNELLKINFKDILAPAPEVRDQFEMYMAELKRDGFSKGLMLVQTKKGETRIWEYNSSLRTEGISTPVVRGMAHDITDRKRAEEEREKLILQLQKALAEVKQLSGLLPICASCKKIRDDKGYWNQIESYIRDHSEAEFSHGICPECMKKLYPGFDESVK